MCDRSLSYDLVDPTAHACHIELNCEKIGLAMEALRKLSTGLIVHVSMASHASFLPKCTGKHEKTAELAYCLSEALFSELSTFTRQLDTKAVPTNCILSHTRVSMAFLKQNWIRFDFVFHGREGNALD